MMTMSASGLARGMSRFGAPGFGGEESELFEDSAAGSNCVKCGASR